MRFYHNYLISKKIKQANVDINEFRKNYNYILKKKLKYSEDAAACVVTLNPMSSRRMRRILAGFPIRRWAYTLNIQNTPISVSIGRGIDPLANTSELS